MKETSGNGIAHRLATVRNAKPILVVEDGRITETGLDENAAVC